MIESLDFISKEEVAGLKPPRLRVHKVEQGETWAGITDKYFGPHEGSDKLAEYNGFESTIEPAIGILIKIPPSLHVR